MEDGPQWSGTPDNTEHRCNDCDDPCAEEFNDELSVQNSARGFSQLFVDQEFTRALCRAVYVPPTLTPFNTTHHPAFGAVRAMVACASDWANCPEEPIQTVKDHILSCELTELRPEHHPDALKIGPPSIINRTTVEFSTNVQPVRPVHANEGFEGFVQLSSCVIRMETNGNVEFINPFLGFFGSF